MSLIILTSVYVLLVVGCDGILGSQLKFDRCGVCGGNDSTCHIISGIFTQTVLSPGYNRVTSIPKGACNINITELAPSLNRLAVKISNGSYIINGKWMLGFSNNYEGAGTVFTYYHPTPAEILESVVEYVIAPGPINSSIDIMVIHEHSNRGIMYTYTLPSHHGHSSANPKHRLRHHGHRHLASSATTDITNLLATDPGSNSGKPDPEAEEIQSDQISGGRYNPNYGALPHNRQQPSYQRQEQPRPYRPHSGTYQYPYGNMPPNQALAVFNDTASSYEPLLDAGVRPSIYRGPHMPYTGPGNYSANQNQEGAADTYSDTGRFVSGGPQPQLRDRQIFNPKPLPGVNYRGMLAGGHPVQPRKSYGVKGPFVPSGGLDAVPQRYISGGQPGIIGYGQPQPVMPLSPYRQPIWYPGQQAAYQAPVIPYQSPSHPSYPQRPYPQVHPPAAVQPPYYSPAGNPVLEQPALDASSYASYDFYRPQARVPTLNDQRVLQSPGTGSQSIFSGATDFAWKISGFSECSKTCGGGLQNTLIVCMKVTGVQVVVTEENCNPSLKPTGRTVSCSNSPCPPSWEASNWTACSTTCDRGQQTRIVECKQRIGATHAVSVSATHCLHEPRPESVRACNEERPCVRWKIGEWSKCSTECGRGQQTREVVCVNYNDKPIAENKCNGTQPRSSELCDMGSCARTWFFTRWSEKCSIGCGEGVQTRQVHCSAEPDRCSEINRPKLEKPCKNEVPCGGRWFTGPWSECTVTCDEGITKRDVVCMKRLGHILAVVNEENCLDSEKPEEEELCIREPCLPEWYMTEWSECSRSCDTGLRTREVKCLDSNQLPFQSCDQEEKPENRQICNTQKCPSVAGHNDTQQLVIACQDKFKNCRVVVQARLCRYHYYKDVCCFSCISHGQEEDT